MRGSTVCSSRCNNQSTYARTLVATSSTARQGAAGTLHWQGLHTALTVGPGVARQRCSTRRVTKRALCCQAATTILLGIDVAHTEPWKLYGTVAAVLGCALGLWAALQVILWDYVKRKSDDESRPYDLVSSSGYIERTIRALIHKNKLRVMSQGRSTHKWDAVGEAYEDIERSLNTKTTQTNTLLPMGYLLDAAWRELAEDVLEYISVLEARIDENYGMRDSTEPLWPRRSNHGLAARVASHSMQALRRVWTSLVAGQLMTQAFGCVINTKINPQLALNLLAWEDFCAEHPDCDSDCLQISKLLISPEVMDAITLQALNRVLQHRRLISLIERIAAVHRLDDMLERV